MTGAGAGFPCAVGCPLTYFYGGAGQGCWMLAPLPGQVRGCAGGVYQSFATSEKRVGLLNAVLQHPG
jgi:hypothetical protein